MTDKQDFDELLKRKFEPFSGWRPAPQSGSGIDAVWEAIQTARRGFDSFMKTMEPYTDQADARIRDLVTQLEGTMGESSKETRAYLAKQLEKMATRLRS